MVFLSEKDRVIYIGDWW